MSQQNNRREFLKTTAATGVGYWVAGGAQADESQSKSGSPNEKINFACIGVDGKGDSDSNDAGRHGNVVAICDVDDNKLDKAAQRFPNAKKYNDFRKMFDEMAASIDAVTVSTPDHTHAVAAIRAMKEKKACFTQKPLTHSLWEARRMAEVAREMKVATQMGNQGTAGGGLRKAAAVVQAGALGPVSEVHVWTNRPIWPQGGPRPAAKEAPKNLHWELWLGPAPEIAYGDGYHPFAWRGWWDFGTGALGDMACHTMNMPFMALNLRDPISVEAETSGHNKESYPKWSVIRYEFPATDKRPAVKMTWYDGGKRPPNELFEGAKLESSGASDRRREGQTLFARRLRRPPDAVGWHHRTRSEVSRVAGTLRRIRAGHQGRRTRDVEFPRLRRTADRDRAVGQPGGLGGRHRKRQEDRMGRQESQGDQRSGVGQDHQARVPRRLFGLSRGATCINDCERSAPAGRSQFRFDPGQFPARMFRRRHGSSCELPRPPPATHH